MTEHYLPFGQHKGCLLRQVPKAYLHWLLWNCKLGSGLGAAVRAELLHRKVDPLILPPEPTLTPEPTCPRCGGKQLAYHWVEDKRRRRQIRRSCVNCGKSLGFAPQAPPFTDLADAVASPTAVLDVLILCEELGISLKSDGQVADFAAQEDYLRAEPSLRNRVAQCRSTLGRLIGKRREVAR